MQGPRCSAGIKAAGLQTAPAPADLEPRSEDVNPLLQMPVSQALQLELQSCTLSLGDHVVLRDISEEIYISQRFQDGIVLGCQSKDGGSYSMLDTNLGQVSFLQYKSVAVTEESPSMIYISWTMSPSGRSNACWLPFHKVEEEER